MFGRRNVCLPMAVALGFVTLLAAAPVRANTYRGAWFSVWYPAGFTVRPSLRSRTSTRGYDSAFFMSKDRRVRFYVHSPQWNGKPTDIQVKPKTERITARTITTRNGVVTRQVSIRARNGSYERAYLDVEDTTQNTRRTFGIQYADRKAYDRYRPAYLRFKASLRQFAD